jgi:hypothetical protein
MPSCIKNGVATASKGLKMLGGRLFFCPDGARLGQKKGPADPLDSLDNLPTPFNPFQIGPQIRYKVLKNVGDAFY